LKSPCHRPLAELQYHLPHGSTGQSRMELITATAKRIGLGPMLPRNFHANAVTLSTICTF